MNENCCTEVTFTGESPGGAFRQKEVKSGSEGSCVGGWVPRADSERNCLSCQRGFESIKVVFVFDIFDKGSGGRGKEKEGKDGRVSGARGGGGVLNGRTHAGSPAPVTGHRLCHKDITLFASIVPPCAETLKN